MSALQWRFLLLTILRTHDGHHIWKRSVITSLESVMPKLAQFDGSLLYTVAIRFVRIDFAGQDFRDCAQSWVWAPAGEIFGTCKNLPQTLSARTELPRCKKKATYIIRSKFEWACSGQRAISVVQIRLLVEKFTPAPGYLFTLSKATWFH